MMRSTVTAPYRIHSTVTAPLAPVNELGQLYDDVTGALLYDDVTGAPLVW